MTWEVDENQLEVWYLNSCTSKHICNSCKRFPNIHLKSYKFVIAEKTIIRSTQIGIITLSLENNSQLTLFNVILSSEYDSNFIFLGQLSKTDILYHDHLKQMVLKQKEKIIGSTIKRINLFVFDISPPLKIMLIKGKD